jgi:hypothetical protein
MRLHPYRTLSKETKSPVLPSQRFLLDLIHKCPNDRNFSFSPTASYKRAAEPQSEEDKNEREGEPEHESIIVDLPIQLSQGLPPADEAEDGFPDSEKTTELNATLVEDSTLARYGMQVMNPYGVLLCKQCKHCILVTGLKDHVKNVHDERLQVTLSVIPELTRKYALHSSRASVPSVPPAARPLPGLEKDTIGFKCSICSYCAPSRKSLGDHFRKCSDETHESATAVQTTIQRFWSRSSSAPYVEVSQSETAPAVEHKSGKTAAERALDLAKAAGYTRQVTLVADDDPRSTHPYVQNSGWGAWLQSVSPDYVEKQKTAMNDQKLLDSIRPIATSFLYEGFAYSDTTTYDAFCRLATPGSECVV